MKRKKKVFITYGWNRISYILRRSLVDNGFDVTVGDISKINMNSMSSLPGRTVVYPSFYENIEYFKNFILNYLLENNIDYLIPVHEESFIFSKYKDEFERKGIKLLVPDFQQIKITHNKFLCNQFAKNNNISTPDFEMPESFEEMENFFLKHNCFVVLKYLETNSAKGVFYIDSLEKLESYKKDLGKFILQEYVKGKGYGVSVLYKNGKLMASFTHCRIQEKIKSGGTSTIRESKNVPVLENAAKSLLDKLDWHGPAMVEFKYDEKEKKHWFIEINPRLWGSFALPFLSGMDFPKLIIDILDNKDFSSQLDYKKDIKVKWLLGSIIASITNLAKLKNPEINNLFSECNGYDDFWMDDPCSFIGQCLYYFLKLVKTGSLNPKTESLLSLDDLNG